MKRIVVATIFAALATGVGAHSPLQRTSPAQGTVLQQAPVEMTFEFGRKIKLTRVTWDAGKGRTGTVDLDGAQGFAKRFTLPFTGQGAGFYLVEWRGLSDDGHPQSGGFTFTVQ